MAIKRERWNRERIIKVLEKEGYELTDEKLDIKSRTAIETICPNNHPFKTNIYQFVTHNKRCKKCRSEEKKKEELKFKQYINERSNEFNVVGMYKSEQQPIDIIHISCGYKWGALPANFTKDIRCPECQGNHSKKSHEQFVLDVFNLVNYEYEVIGRYTTNRSEVKMKHTKCGHEWDANPRNFLHNNRRCPKCNASKGETRIQNYLDLLRLTYIKEHEFIDCKDKSSLPFDFKLKYILIEYDGELHFEQGRFSKDNDKMILKLHKTQKHDKIKNKYCIEINMPLIRIPYWEYENIEYILEHVLGYYDIINKQDVDENLVHKYLVNHPNWSHEKYITEAPCNKKKELSLT